MALKILSVDDEPALESLLTQFFRRKIRKGEYEFRFAHNGIEALQVLLNEQDIDIILSDINMPEMDGLTLLTKVNEMRNPALKCIMVSAYGDMGNIRTAMNNGAFDFATKPIDLDDLALTIEKAAEQIEFVKQTQAEHKELTSIHSDLSLASEIQHAILPRKFPPFKDLAEQVDIFASMKPAKDVGGDFYDFFRIGEDKIGFVMADVSGKGVPAALFMAVSRTLIHTVGLLTTDPSDCITRSNNMLCQESLDSMFVTVFYGIYDINTGEMTYVNAGHNPPYILRADGALEKLPMTRNFVVGGIEGFNYVSDKLQLNPGDTLMMYTDGVTEACNEQFELYNEERLEAVLKASGSASCQQLVCNVADDMATFVGDAEQSDDTTMLAVKRLK